MIMYKYCVGETQKELLQHVISVIEPGNFSPGPPVCLLIRHLKISLMHKWIRGALILERYLYIYRYKSIEHIVLTEK